MDLSVVDFLSPLLFLASFCVGRFLFLSFLCGMAGWVGRGCLRRCFWRVCVLAVVEGILSARLWGRLECLPNCGLSFGLSVVERGVPSLVDWIPVCLRR